MVEMTQTEALECTTPATNGGLKAVILAAGKETISADGQPLILETLGDRSILECVLQNALQAVRAEDIYIVVGDRQEQVRSLLGERYNYVVQQEPLGTGDAVLRVCRLLGDFPGNLLILYGDTPLLRPGTIRGLLNRHRLRKAHLTVLTANVDRPLPYGRIIRDAAGQIIDIIEDKDASAQVREIHELNVGAYVVDAGILGPRSASCPFAARRRIPAYRLRASAHPLAAAGSRTINSTTRTRCRASTPRRIWNRPSSFFKSVSIARAGKKNRTWSPLEQAAGAPSSAKASPCTTSAA